MFFFKTQPSVSFVRVGFPSRLLFVVSLQLSSWRQAVPVCEGHRSVGEPVGQHSHNVSQVVSCAHVCPLAHMRSACGDLFGHIGQWLTRGRVPQWSGAAPWCRPLCYGRIGRSLTSSSPVSAEMLWMGQAQCSATGCPLSAGTERGHMMRVGATRRAVPFR